MAKATVAARPRRNTGRHAQPDAVSNTLAKPKRNAGRHRAVETPDEDGSLRLGNGGRKSRTTYRPKLPVPTNRNYSGILVAEYMAALGFSALNIFVGDESYHDRLARFFVQASALTAVFFMLALASQSESSGKFAAAFGGLIDVAILFHVSTNGTIKNVNAALHGTKDNPTGSSEQLKSV